MGTEGIDPLFFESIFYLQHMKAIPVRQIAEAGTVKGGAGRFSIRSLRQVLNGQKLVHDLHRHNFYFVLAIEKGEGVHEIDFTPHQVRDHSVFILRPGQVHRLELSTKATGFLMEFDLAFYQPKTMIGELRWRKAVAKNYCGTDARNYKALDARLAGILREYTDRQEGYLEAIRAQLDLFFIDYTRQSRDPKAIAGSESGYIQDRFEELTRLLETHISMMKRVSQYAGLMNLSSYQLNAISKSSVDKNVSELINDQIILEAKRHLLATSSPVKEIADLLGYEDPSYFIRFFRKQTGQSPDMFRKNFK